MWFWRFFRCGEVDFVVKNVVVNEFVYMDKFVVMKFDRIIGRC